MIFVKPSTVESVVDQIPAGTVVNVNDDTLLGRLVKATLRGLPIQAGSSDLDLDTIIKVISNSKQPMHETLNDESVDLLNKIANAQLGFVRNTVSHIVDKVADVVTTKMEDDIIIKAPVRMQAVIVPDLFKNDSYLARLRAVAKQSSRRIGIKRGDYNPINSGALDGVLAKVDDMYQPLFDALATARVTPEDIYNKRISMVSVEDYPTPEQRIAPFAMRFDLLEAAALEIIARACADDDTMDANKSADAVTADMRILAMVTGTFIYNRLNTINQQIKSGNLIDNIDTVDTVLVANVFDVNYKNWIETSAVASADVLFGMVLFGNSSYYSNTLTDSAYLNYAERYTDYLERIQSLRAAQANTSRTKATLVAMYNFINGEEYEALATGTAPDAMRTQVCTYIRENPARVKETTVEFVERVVCAGMFANRDCYRILTTLKDVSEARPELPIEEVTTITVTRLLVETLVNNSITIN